MPEARAHIGTSGWNCRWWRGVFYPEDLPQRDWHGYYVRHFDTVEINATFYRLPRLETFERWREAAPDGFVYAVKASRLTGPAAYWRFHGFTRGPDGNYAESTLAAAAKRMREELARGVPIYAYFNNDAHGCAVRDARRLVEMLCIREARREPRRPEQRADQ